MILSLKVSGIFLLDEENIQIVVPSMFVELGCSRACHLARAEFLEEAESDGRCPGAAAHPKNERVFIGISSTL
jgi:hypothetical protein